MNVENSSSAYTAEEMHYLYDSSGRLLTSAFAQSPQTGSGAPTSAPYYTASYPAATRARAYYAYDPAGRVLTLNHWWDTWSGSAFTSSFIQGNSCTYETSGTYNRGLKTANAFATTASYPSPAWTESYGYDPSFDYLTSANYGDGQPNASQTWTYDAAGNRASDYTGSAWTYDNLNRMPKRSGGPAVGK